MTQRSIDWLNCTLPLEVTMADLQTLLPFSFESCAQGLYGYKSQIVALGGSIRILFDGTSTMGQHVQISGEGWGFLRSVEGFRESGFIEELLRLGGSVTRLDLALDCKDGSVSVDRVREHVRAGSLTSRFRQWEDRRSGSVGKNEAKGDGMYFGNPTSDMRLRVYDKGLQLGTTEPWTRFEFQARRERAQQLAQMVAAGDWDGAIGVCRSYIEFREYRLESNPSMAPISQWWEQFVTVGKVIARCVSAVVASYTKTCAWVARQVAPALAVMTEFEGGDLYGAFLSIIEDGRTRYRDKHRLMLSGSLA